MSAVVPVIPRFRFVDVIGKPVAMGSVTVYLAGTTTLAVTYQDEALSVPNANPVPLNALGECMFWFDPANRLKFLVKDAAGATVPGWPVDDIPGASDSGLRADLAASGGSALVNFLQAGVGAGARTLQSRGRDWVSVKDFLCDDGLPVQGDNTHDDTTGMQRAHATGRIVYYPAGVYIFSKLTFTKGGIVGDGANQTILVSFDNTTSDVILMTATGDYPVFREFNLQCQVTKPAGAALHITSPTNVTNPRVEGIVIVNCYIGVQFTNCQNVMMSHSVINQCTTACVYIESTVNADAGDSTIHACYLQPLPPIGRGILHRSGGGWRFVNLKIIGGLIGYSMEFTGVTNSSDTFLTGCSLEAASQAQVLFSRASGVGLVGNVMITGCEIGGDTGIIADTVVTLLNITGNNIQISGTTAGNVGISLTNISHFIVGPNVINGNAGASLAITVDAACTNGKIAAQTYTGFADANCLVNSSTSTYVQKSRQSGTATLPAATAYSTSALFVATATVTFPTPFKEIPTVTCAPSASGTGGIACYAQAISKTGFTLVGITVTNGGVMANNVWAADGLV